MPDQMHAGVADDDAPGGHGREVTTSADTGDGHGKP